MKTPSVTTLHKIFLSGLLVSLPGLSISHAQLAAFPGAEGTGAYAAGGRYGDVYHVTTTSSSQTTPGSFYYGIANAPAAGRTIVFDVSGYIHTGGTYTIGKSKITIAGQTAPGDGIGFKDGTINLTGNDLIIRNIRFRDGNSADSVDLGNNSNIMMDHCDVMFSNDENLSSFGTPPDLFTFQWCMNSWGMETHSCGGLWDQNRATCHHSLWSHNHTRNPKVRSALLDWVNNVTFDWDIGFIMGDSSSGANWNANVRGSYFVSPPGNTHGVALEKANLDGRGNPNFHLYIEDSAMDGDGDGVLSVSKTGYDLASGSYGVSATPFATAGIPVTIDDHLTAYKKVLSATGPVRMDSNPSMSLRDELNTLAVNNVIQQRRFHINAPGKTGVSGGGFGTLNSAPPVVDTDQDGMPDFWESTLGSNPNLDDHTNAVPAGAFVPTGYTRLEEYLQFLMMPHTAMAKSTAAVPNALDVDLHKYTFGFTNNLPVTYTISNVTTGTVAVVNGYLAHFVPPTNFYGRARFDFTVTDGDGSTWTQTFAALVSIVSLPRDLIWKGDGASNNFDTNTLSFLFGTNTTAYSIGDNVTFDDTGSTNPAVNLVGSLTPGSVNVNSTKTYTLGGSGTFIGGMKLKQSGGGTLNVNTANAFTGGGTIDSSTLVLNSGGDIGNGGFTLQNATITSTYGATTSYALDNLLTIPDGTTSTINLSPRMSVGGVSGNGTLNLNISGTVFQYDNLNSAYGGFTGTLNLTGTVPNALVTAQFNGGAFDGNLANATVKLDNVALIGRHNSGGNTLYVGALTGTATSGFQGSGFAGPMNLTVGGLNRDTEFAGSITSVNNTNRIVKVGTGKWTLSGSNNFSGALIVSNGTVLVTGSDAGNIVSVVNGGTLRGTGYLAGGVSIQSGGKLLPGIGDGQPGTLTTSNTLSLATPYLFFDLSGSPSGANDKIVMQGGSIAMSGAQNYVFYLTDLALGAGTYKLIDGATSSSATGVTLLSNLPGNTRQTISLYKSGTGNPSYVRLDVSGTAASLLWTGTNGSAWDVSTTNWLNGSAADKFFNLDTVTFDDTSTNGAVTVTPYTGTVQPVFLTVSNSTHDYTINGGGIAGQTILVKNGSGMLTLSPYAITTTCTMVNNSTMLTVGSTNGIAPGLVVSGPHIPANTTVLSLPNSTNVIMSQAAQSSVTYANLVYFCAANSYTGGTVVNSGTLQLVNNLFGGGTGPIALNGGTLYLNGIGTGTTITCAGTNTLQTSGQPYASFGLQGSGVLNLNIGGGGVFTPGGDWSGFSGTINFLTGNWLREGASSFGSSNAVWNLGSNGGIYNKDGGASVYLGALFGGASAALAGGQTGTPMTTYVVGGINTNSVFNGTIFEGGLGTALVFNGPGSLTLTGTNNNYSANTLVNGGVLYVNNLTGNGTGPGDVQVGSGATLAGNGSISGLVSIADGATLAPGNSTGILTIGDGLVLGDGSILNFELGTVSDGVNITGDLTFGGTLNVTNMSGYGVGAYTLFTYGGQLSLGHLIFGAKPAGYNYFINTSTPGQVNLIVAPTTPPSFVNLAVSGSNLVLSGNNGVPLGNYYVIGSTNLALPMTDWTRIATNQFDATGSFTFTNVPNPNSSQWFYRLQLP